MNRKDEIASHPSTAGWTRPEAYIGALARKRTYRRARAERPRSQPAAPRAWLSTVPFLAVLAVLAILAVSIMIVAFPGAQAVHRAQPKATPERGVAQRGWLQEAQKQCHN